MLNLFKKGFQKGVLATVGSLAILCGTGAKNFGGAEAHFAVQEKKPIVKQTASWRKFHSVQGSCSIALPSSPEHVKQVMPMNEEGYDLRYDVYVSAHERKAVYMLLIAQYPPFVNETYAEASLETFLNGLLTQNPNNRLIFADMTEVQGNKALDFFIEAKGVYFKGRVLMANNNLYLLAMECETKNYTEEHFNHFIGSFELAK